MIYERNAGINNGGSVAISASSTRPDNTDAYIAGDVVGTSPATNISFSGVSSVAGGSVVLQSISLRIDVAAIPAGMSTFRLHLYNADPTAIADSAAYNLPSGDRTKYLGFIEVDTPIDLGDTLWVQKDNIGMLINLATGSTSLYGMLETRGGYTPTALVAKTLALHVLEV